jgi:acetoin utilization deacetylase AcuC-like enzyme
MFVSARMAVKTGIVRDKRYLEHKPGHMHPEHPNRLKAVYKMLDSSFPVGLLEIEPEPATLEQIELFHSPSYIKKVLKTADHGFTSLAPDTPASSRTYLSAWLAVGGCLKALDTLVSGQCEVCLSLVRPPGHHALRDRAGGFCVFNNLGITARYAIQRYDFQRILIIDWDIHHGNGLNDIFYEDKQVLYVSSHDIMLYPYTGDWKETGKGEGEGYTINIPIPRTLKDEDFFYLYHEIVCDVLRAFSPQLVLVGAGFDAHHEDPVGRSKLSEQTFRWLTHMILDIRAEIDHPPILLVLEGGYSPRALASCVKEVLDALKFEGTWERPSFNGVEQGDELVRKIRRIHGKYGVW